jgi:hypothetical protein
MNPTAKVKTAIASSIFLLAASIVSAQGSPQQAPAGIETVAPLVTE